MKKQAKSPLKTARYFADRKARADFKAFDKILRRCGGKPPREGDEMPGASDVDPAIRFA